MPVADVGFNHGEMVDREPCLVPPYATNCGWAFSIVNVYFDDYYPAAIATAQALRTRGGPERLIWTTHPWLLSMFFDCPQHLWPQLHCPDTDALAAMEAAIRRGDISWHAGCVSCVAVRGEAACPSANVCRYVASCLVQALQHGAGADGYEHVRVLAVSRPRLGNQVQRVRTHHDVPAVRRHNCPVSPT